MKPGAYISGIGHAGLIGWLFFGPGFSADPLPFEVTEVAVISAEDFAVLTAGGQPSDPVIETAQPVTPVEDTPPEPAPAPVTPTEPAAPELAPPAEDTPPDVSQITTPPTAEVEDTPPAEPPAPALGQSATLVTGATVRPKPRPAPRVAPTPVAQPEPDADVADVAQEQTNSNDAAEVPVEEQDAAAPEAAATEIVTEAEKDERTEDAQVSAAPVTSTRPTSRPNRPAPSTQTQTAEDTANSVNDAIAEALGDADTTPAPQQPTGPPLTGGERDALRVAVSQCWNVGSLSSEALATTVVVAMSMTQDGKPVTNSIQLKSFSGGSESAANKAYQAARRAIIRCGANGYNLPNEKYDQWQEIEMTFNPAKMRLK